MRRKTKRSRQLSDLDIWLEKASRPMVVGQAGQVEQGVHRGRLIEKTARKAERLRLNDCSDEGGE